MKETPLKPCPWCGTKGEVFSISGSYGYYSSKTGVKCPNEGCLVKPSVAFDDETYDWTKRKYIPSPSLENAIKAWNQRHS